MRVAIPSRYVGIRVSHFFNANNLDVMDYFTQSPFVALVILAVALYCGNGSAGYNFLLSARVNICCA